MAAADASAAPSPSDAGDELPRKDHFLRLMLYHPSDWPPGSQGLRHAGSATGPYAPLPQLTATSGVRLALPQPLDHVRVTLDSAASEVMTDLRRVGAVTIAATVAIDEANTTMIARRVRALFVTDDAREVLGILTATDILGERPVKFAQERGIRFNDVLVRDIMTPAERLEILNLRDVQVARVGDVVATLRHAGRQHALVVEATADGQRGGASVRGIFSLTQIAKQLGIPAPSTHDLPRTFAEIEAIVGS